MNLRHFSFCRTFFITLIMMLAAILTLSCGKDKSPANSNSPNPPAGKTLKYIGSAFWRGHNDVEIRGDYAYAAMTYGLHIMNVSDPSSVQHVSSLPIPSGTPRRLTLSGNYVYLIGPDCGLQIVDITDPANPSKVGECQTPGDGVDVAIIGTYAYVADGYSQLQIIDISNPVSPRLLGGLNIPYYSGSILVRGDYAYVTNYGAAGLWILDVSNPAAPTILGSFDTPGVTTDLVLSGDYALLADMDGAFLTVRVVNIANPNSPQPVDSLSTPIEGFTELAIYGEYVYALMGAKAHVIDLSAGADNPSWGESFGSFVDPREIIAAGERLYISDYEDGLYMYSLSNPAAPIQEARTGFRGGFVDVAIKGHYAFAAAGVSGLRVIDIADPTNLEQVKYYQMPNSATAVTIAGDYAFVSDLAALEILNITDPLNPVLVGNFVTAGNCHRVSVVGENLYIAAGSAGLQIVNITAPDAPIHISTYVSSSPAWDVVVDDTIAYIAGEQFLEIISIANLHNPYFISRVNWSLGYYGHLIKYDHYLLVGEVVVFDVANPKTPQWITGATPGGGNVTVQGNWAIWTWGDAAWAINLLGLPNFEHDYGSAFWQGNGLFAQGIASDSTYIYLAGERAFVVLKLE